MLLLLSDQIAYSPEKYSVLYQACTMYMYVHEQFEQGMTEMAGCVSITTLLGIVNVVNVFP